MPSEDLTSEKTSIVQYQIYKAPPKNEKAEYPKSISSSYYVTMIDGKTSYEITKEDYEIISNGLLIGAKRGGVELKTKHENGKWVTRVLRGENILSVYKSEGEEPELALKIPLQSKVMSATAGELLLSNKTDNCYACSRIFVLGTIDEPASSDDIKEMQAQLDKVLSDPNYVMVTTPRLSHLSCKNHSH